MPRRIRPRSRWRRHRRNRLIAVAALLALGVASLVAQASGAPAAAPGVTVAMAAREVRSGTVLQSADVTVTELPAESPLAAAGLALDQVLGRTSVGDLQPGEMVTPSRLIDQAVRPGFATMPVSFEDPELSRYLSPGMRIDIVWTPGDLSGDAPSVIARDARVLQVGTVGDDAGVGGATSVPVLLEVAESDAVALAGAMGSGALSVLVR